MNFLELVRENRSYRGYDQSVKVPREQLESLVELARLCPSSVNLQPLKYYLAYTQEQTEILQPLTGWARRLTHLKLPHPGHCPTAFVVILHDREVAPDPARFFKDVGIVAQTMLLGAVEQGLGGCMIGNFDPKAVRVALKLKETLEPVLIVALGKPDETVVLTDVLPGGDVGYYRDEADRHYVPKRTREELIVNQEK